MKNTKVKVPLGIKILAILNWIGAGILIILSLFTILGINLSEEIANELSSSFILLSLLWLLLGVCFILIGRGLWKGKNWARILELVIALFSIISTIGEIIMVAFSLGILINLVVAGLVVWYLLANKEGRKFFNR